ncbi:hypothetical protein M2138_000855 [Dysgonomonadaceae bacterium PH5-43]|nr:hypothetical protein [Dysgonomonadaceae bacterium PH5-43]
MKVQSPHKIRHYKSLANYYKNLPIRQRRVKASVHLESGDDVHFWKTIFKHYFPKDNFHFITYSRSHSGNNATGSAQCLAYKDYLSKEFVVCIDSDYKYISGYPNIDINHFIFQTYTYSFENHNCYSAGLSDVCKASTGYDNNYYNFENFFVDYSNIIFDLFAWHIALYRRNHKAFPIKSFLEVITLQSGSNDIYNESKEFLYTINIKVQNKIRKLRKDYPSINIHKEKEHLYSLGIHDDNVYLFVRGHNIHALCVSIGRDVCKWILNEEKGKSYNSPDKISKLYNERRTFKSKIRNNILFEEYPEIQKIGEDMNYYKSLFNK